MHWAGTDSGAREAAAEARPGIRTTVDEEDRADGAEPVPQGLEGAWPQGADGEAATVVAHRDLELVTQRRQSHRSGLGSGMLYDVCQPLQHEQVRRALDRWRVASTDHGRIDRNSNWQR